MAVETVSLSVSYALKQGGKVYALRKADFRLPEAGSVAIVGESGCGKSTLALSLLSLLPDNADYSGEALIFGKKTLGASGEELRRVRGIKAGIIFQDPCASLNPVFTIKQQIEETILAHMPGTDKKELREIGLSLLEETGIQDPERVYMSYPHQLSGGQQQRVMTSIALSCGPGLLIADEPTTALDVTVQAQIVALLKKLRKKRRLALMLITHDLHLALELSDRIVVMYAGEIVEDSLIRGVKDARHPYTRLLFEVIPDINSRKKKFKVIPGSLPDLRVLSPGCYFKDRCPRAKARCGHERPELTGKAGHVCRCFYPLD
ncbi:MAG TPA: ABC transporter ATP-binding protein [Candidatus Goldiibacteriota bacterium]|nr:ABC transporter ATP-binding protein [Candidatus Goldiibacteriota bacterium]